MHAKLLQPAQVVEPLASFPDHSVCVCCPGEAVCNVYTEELKTTAPFDLSVADIDELGCPPLAAESPPVNGRCWSEIIELGDELRRHDAIQCKTVINKEHSQECVPVFQVGEDRMCHQRR